MSVSHRLAANGGADPLVRAGPLDPLPQALTNTSSRPTWASAADQGVRTTLHWSIRDRAFSTLRTRHAPCARTAVVKIQSGQPTSTDTAVLC
jgi:hypothetical protein